MTRRRIRTAFGTIGGTIGLALAAIALLVWAWPAAAQATKVRLQLKWVTQAQFAGYYAAKSQGFYKAENLDVTIIPGGPDIVPEQVVAGRGAEFGIDFLPSLLSAREQGVPLVNIAQVFAYSGMRELAFKTSGIKTPADLKGRKVAVWFGGNEFALLATLAKYKLDPQKDLTLVQQPFDMNLLLQKQVDAAAAMTYNEYKQVLDGGVKPEDLVVIDFNQEGTAMLEDGIFTRADWLQAGKNKETGRAVRAGLAQGLGVLPGPGGRVRRHGPEGEPGAREAAPGLDDGRDQQARLGPAGAQDARREDGSRGLQAHRGHRAQVRGDQEARRAGGLHPRGVGAFPDPEVGTAKGASPWTW